jgi:NAD(P)H-hydrate epimerase
LKQLDTVPALTSEEMARVDRILIDELGWDVLQLMESAGRMVAEFARERFLDGNCNGRRVVVLAGRGNNGGDGMVAARYLHSWGASVEVVLASEPERLGETARRQYGLLRSLGLRHDATWDGPADLVIDALLGFGLRRPPEGVTAELILQSNDRTVPVLAIDVPSGLDATGGQAFEPCIRATATLTLALPKRGLLTAGASAWTGELVLADIGVPPEIYARLGHDVGTIFARRPLVPVAGDNGVARLIAR